MRICLLVKAMHHNIYIGQVSLYSISLLFERSNLKQGIFTLVMLFALGACTHHYAPNASTFKFDPITEFSTNNFVSLVNSHTSADDVLYLAFAGHKHYGNYQQWTDTASEIARRELSKRGMTIVDSTQKSVNMSVETVNITVGMWAARCELTLKVATGEGYAKTYLGDNRSPATVNRAIDGAVMRAVAEMLRDQEIIAYLKK